MCASAATRSLSRSLNHTETVPVLTTLEPQVRTNINFSSPTVAATLAAPESPAADAQEALNPGLTLEAFLEAAQQRMVVNLENPRNAGLLMTMPSDAFAASTAVRCGVCSCRAAEPEVEALRVGSYTQAALLAMERLPYLVPARLTAGVCSRPAMRARPRSATARRRAVRARHGCRKCSLS